MKIKRLSLQRWMCKPEIYPHDIDERGAPIGKNGWYYKGGLSWFEFNGNGYTTPRLEQQFLYELKDLNRPKLSLDQKNWIKSLDKHSELRPYLKELKDIIILDNMARGLALFGFRRKKERYARLNEIMWGDNGK